MTSWRHVRFVQLSPMKRAHLCLVDGLARSKVRADTRGAPGCGEFFDVFRGSLKVRCEYIYEGQRIQEHSIPVFGPEGRASLPLPLGKAGGDSASLSSLTTTISIQKTRANKVRGSPASIARHASSRSTRLPFSSVSLMQSCFLEPSATARVVVKY